MATIARALQQSGYGTFLSYLSQPVQPKIHVFSFQDGRLICSQGNCHDSRYPQAAKIGSSDK